MLYKYNLWLALKFAQKSLFYLKHPPNYWRALEYKLVLQEGVFKENDVILDIGSPKLLSLYLAKVVCAKVFATDIDDSFIENLKFLRWLENINPQKLHIGVEDGRHLSFDDGYFNKVYSISVIEHIPDQGDTECVKEIARVLSKNGRCIITVPFWPTTKIDYKDEKDFYWSKHSAEMENGSIFYQRRYSEQDLFERIINPSALTLEKLQFIGERVLTKSKKELIEILPRRASFIEPLLSRLLLKKPVDSWKSLKKPLAALIVLGK
jgi:SAM-dependent methyltransferase